MELIFKNADAKVETKGDSSLNKQQLCVQSATEMKKKIINSKEEKVKPATRKSIVMML